jgi:hypothetical protein
MPMDRETKDEVAQLAFQDKDVRATIIESELVPAVQEEPEHGPTPDMAPEINHAPDPSALAAWMDDLSEFGDSHRGDVQASEVLDKLASGALDDVQGTARGHYKDDVNADVEQKGMVPDFHADSALEGAAIAEGQPAPVADLIVPPARKRTALDDGAGDGGGGGGGGGGGTPPGGTPPDDGEPAEPADDDKPDKKPAKAAAKPPPAKPAEPPKAPPKKDDKKRDGDR